MFYICIIDSLSKLKDIKFGMKTNVITQKENIKLSEGIDTLLNIVYVTSSSFDIKPFINTTDQSYAPNICFVVANNILEKFMMQNKNILMSIQNLKIVNFGMIEKNFKVFINVNRVKLNDIQLEIQNQERKQVDVFYNYKDVCYNFDFFTENYAKLTTEKLNTISLSVNAPSTNTPKFVNLLNNINSHGEKLNIIFVKKYNIQKDDITCKFLEHFFRSTNNVKIYTNSIELFHEYENNPIIHFYNIGEHIFNIINLFIPQNDIVRASELTPYFYIYYYDNDDQDNHVYKSVYSAIKSKMEFTKNFFTEIEK